MKKWGLILGFLLISVLLIGQSFNQDSVRYITPAEEAFMIDKETNSLLKIDYESRLGGSDELSATYERKINRDMSISALLSYSDGWHAGGEFRYYHRMGRRIDAGLQKDNLSDNYFGVRYRSNFNQRRSIRLIDRNLSLAYGVQRRVLNKYYLDYSLSLQYSNLSLNGESIGGALHLVSRAKVGLGFGKNHKMEAGSLCPILRCNTDKYSLLKINFNNTLGIGIINVKGRDTGSFGFSISPDIGYEVKLGKSNWSLNQNVVFGYGKRFNSYRGSRYINFEYSGGFRFYHLQRKRILLGKSGNNLNGPYFLTRTTYTSFNSKYNNPDDSEEFLKSSAGYVDIGYGYQSFLLEKFFVDIALGWRKGAYSSDFPQGGLIFFDLKAGFAF